VPALTSRLYTPRHRKRTPGLSRLTSKLTSNRISNRISMSGSMHVSGDAPTTFLQAAKKIDNAFYSAFVTWFSLHAVMIDYIWFKDINAPSIAFVACIAFCARFMMTLSNQATNNRACIQATQCERATAKQAVLRDALYPDKCADSVLLELDGHTPSSLGPQHSLPRPRGCMRCNASTTKSAIRSFAHDVLLIMPLVILYVSTAAPISDVSNTLWLYMYFIGGLPAACYVKTCCPLFWKLLHNDTFATFFLVLISIPGHYYAFRDFQFDDSSKLFPAIFLFLAFVLFVSLHMPRDRDAGESRLGTSKQHHVPCHDGERLVASIRVTVV
jgi:hypothetical protein